MLDRNENIMDLESTLWDFYIKFKVSKPLEVDQQEIVFLNNFIIKADSGESLKEATTLRLENSNPMIYRELIQESKKVEQALILAFSEMDIGIAYAENLASIKIEDDINNITEESFIKKHTAVHDEYFERPLIHWENKFGINLFPADSVPWDSKIQKETAPLDLTEFSCFFIKYYDQLSNIFFFDKKFKKIEIATKILTTSQFDDSLINKIILSMTVIEVLSEKNYRSDNEIDAIKKLIEYLPKIISDNNTKKSLEQGLKSMMKQSISKNCRVLIKRLLGNKDAKKFYDLYNFRSQLVHSGDIDDSNDLYRIYREAYILASNVLIAYVDDISKNSKNYSL